MKILLLTTGGTIASVIDDGVIDVTDSGRLLVLKKYKELDSDTQFDICSPINILSENICNDDYVAIAKTVLDIDFENYDGVIITHGSDTLAYTSALVGLLLCDTQIPVCLVAADKALEDERSNGMDNFIAAVKLIKTGAKGVFVPYRNSDNKVHIHYATKLFQSGILSDDFYSLGEEYSVFENGIFTKSTHSETERLDTSEIDLSFSKKIIQIMPYPQLDYTRIDTDGADAVLHHTYHAGSVCVNENKHLCALSFMNRCKEKNIPFYICGLKKDKSNYDSMSQVLENGAVPLFDMAPACAYMKIMLEG